MNFQDYMHLKNGSDVRGVASEGIEGEAVTLHEESAANIAKGFCVWLSAHTGKKKLCVAVGYDSRISSTSLCEAAVNAILAMGHDVVVTGLSTTPSMFMLLKDEEFKYKCHGSVMITASHLPFNRNGLKFFSHAGGLEGEDVQEILVLAARGNFEEKEEKHFGERVDYPYLDCYAANLVATVRKATKEETPLAGKKIIVDAGNGAGGFYAYKVLQPLGADIKGSQFLDPDGFFPHHAPNPENKQAMESVCEAVKAAKADFGIIFDTDVDRAGAVDKNGEEINRNRLIALISAILLEEKAGTIVTDSVTSDGLSEFISQKGGKHHRFKRGYKNVINEALRLNAAGEYTPLAMETSGHAALMENHFLDDGAYLITRLLVALAKLAKEGKELTDLIADLKEPKEATEIRLRFADGCDFKLKGRDLLQDLNAYAQKKAYLSLPAESYEGCRISYDRVHGDGWALLRMSLHEPILPINIESDKAGGAMQIVKDLYHFLKDYPYLNLQPLKDAIAQYRAGLLAGAIQAHNENKLSFLF